MEWNIKNKFDVDGIKKLLNDNGFKILRLKFNYYGGFNIVKSFPFWLAYKLVKIINILGDSKELIIVCEKFD